VEEGGKDFKGKKREPTATPTGKTTKIRGINGKKEV